MPAVAIAVFEGAEELDFVGPWEVLAAWRYLYPDEVSLSLLGDSVEPVTCAKRMRVLPECTWDDVGPIDLLVYPAAAEHVPSSTTRAFARASGR
jgi:putative intracellular protease/amidase